MHGEGCTTAPINARGTTGLKYGGGRWDWVGDPKQQVKMHSRTGPDPDRPPDPAAHAHTAVRPAGPQILEAREAVEHAGLDARYVVGAELPGGGERSGGSGCKGKERM